MQINVSQLLKEPIGSQRDYEIKDDINILEESGSSAVEGNARLMRTNRSILVKGDFKTSVKTACSRCLESYSQPLEVKFEEEFFPAMDISEFTMMADEEEEDESCKFIIDNNRSIDLTEAIRQYALLAMPMKPLCSPDCKGL